MKSNCMKEKTTMFSWSEICLIGIHGRKINYSTMTLNQNMLFIELEMRIYVKGNIKQFCLFHHSLGHMLQESSFWNG